MGKILLVDDQPPHESHFRHLFGQAVDVCRNHDDLRLAITRGADWSAAFVDFDLAGTAGEPQPTGLSALLQLAQHRPQTKRIAYTTLTDNGRTLYAVAARHWLNTTVIIDKASDNQTLIKAASPGTANPTPPGWQDKLKDACLIDDLFAQYSWLSLWRLWRFYNGSIKAVRDHLPRGSTPTSVREFSEKAAPAADNFRSRFEGINSANYNRKNTAQAAPLVAFADAHSKFFHAPDLQDVLEFAKPWDRNRSRPRTRADRQAP